MPVINAPDLAMKTNPLSKLQPQTWMIHAAGASVLLAAAASAYAGFFAPMQRDKDQRTERMHQLQALMASSEQIALEHRRLGERLGALREAATDTGKRIPRRTSSQEFIEKASQIANSLGLQMELCTAAAPEEQPTHAQVEVTCRLNGSYASVCRYLAAIDQLSQISKVSLLKLDSSTNSRAYPVELTFQLYYRRELNDTEVKRGTLL